MTCFLGSIIRLLVTMETPTRIAKSGEYRHTVNANEA